MYVVINIAEDGDTYGFFTSLQAALNHYDVAIKYIKDIVYLLETEEGKEFGFGAHGDVFGATVLKKTENCQL